MRALFIGGTGIISTAVTRLAVERGIDLTLLTRGQHKADLPSGVKTLRADINDHAAMLKAVEGQMFDCIVDWVAYTPEHIERDIKLLSGKTRQYIFISSASAYKKPVDHYVITEKTPLANPHWQYSRDKIACEERLMRAHSEHKFPVTIVRPSLTYGDAQIPLIMNSWEKPYAAVDRMIKGKKVIIPGDGTSLWVITHNSDFAKGFVGLIGNQRTLGEVYHITSEEARTWDQYYTIVAETVGVKPNIVHIPSDFLIACVPDLEGTLIGDKSVSCVFDNSKIWSIVPDFRATTPFAEGIRQTIAVFKANPSRQAVDTKHDAMCDKLIEAYERGLNLAVQTFAAARG